MLEEIQLKKGKRESETKKKQILRYKSGKWESVRNSLVLAIIIVLKPCSL